MAEQPIDDPFTTTLAWGQWADLRGYPGPTYNKENSATLASQTLVRIEDYLRSAYVQRMPSRLKANGMLSAELVAVLAQCVHILASEDIVNPGLYNTSLNPVNDPQLVQGAGFIYKPGKGADIESRLAESAPVNKQVDDLLMPFINSTGFGARIVCQ